MKNRALKESIISGLKYLLKKNLNIGSEGNISIRNEKGFFISKIFMGGNFNEIVARGKKIFKEVKVFKPNSSRKDSKESFIICKNLR